MPNLRSFIGSACPTCAKDILQAAPAKARMPPGNYLVCPGCETEHTFEMLTGGGPVRRGGLLRRLFGRPGEA